jgi:hypothetical protein
MGFVQRVAGWGIERKRQLAAMVSNYFRNDIYSKLRSQHKFEANRHARSSLNRELDSAVTLPLIGPPSYLRIKFRNCGYKSR